MVKVLGIIFIAILLALPIALVDFFMQAGFVLKMAREQSLGIMGTILALNIATATYLVSTLLAMERDQKKELFRKTKGEVRDNIYFMAVLFGLNLLALSFTKNLEVKDLYHNPNTSLISSEVSLVLLILMVISLLEIVSAVFRASKAIRQG